MKDARTWIIIGLVIVIALLILFSPSKPIDQIDNQAFKDRIETLRWEKSLKDAQLKAIIKESEDNDSTTKVELRAKDKEISLLKAKLSKQRPVIQPIIDSIPELKAFIATQDSVILVTEQRADNLQMALTSQLETIRDLRTLIIDKDRISNEMFVTCSQQLDKADRLANKEHKRKTFFKKLAGVLGIIVITETLLLVAP
jgi:hypothetical protein